MKTRLLLSLAIAAIACTATAQYSYQAIFQEAVSGVNHVTLFGGSTDFEDIDMTDGFFAGNTIDASIEEDASVTNIPAANRPANYSYATNRVNVLAVDAPTNAPLFRKLNADGSAPEVGRVYADMLIKGTPHKWNEEVLPTSAEDKILVYFKETAENGIVGGTNLYVRAGAFVGSTCDEFLEGGYEYKLTTPGVTAIEADAWYRIVLVSLPNHGGLGQGFQIYLGGFGPGYLCTGPGAWFVGDGEYDACDDFILDKVFLSLTTDENFLPGTMTSLGFTGSVSVDDFVVSTADPDRVAVTLSWPDGLRDPYCVIGTATNSLEVEGVTSPLTLQVPAGTEVALGGYTDYRELAESLTASGAGASLSLPEQGIFWYFPQTDTADQDGTAEHPFEIADVDDLNTLKDAVATLADARSLCYVQIADIDFTGEAAFAGIGTYNGSDVGNIKAGDPRGGVPFTGTYDGQGHKISNIAFESKSYAGVFNQVNGGTIKNLTVENATGAKGISIVGNAGNGATLQNLVAEGTFGSAAQPANHNAAGIVIRASAGGTGTLISNCVNNATIYGSYTKLAGICVLTQTKVSGGAVTFFDCANNGDLYLNRNDDDITGFAGIVGYVQDDTVLVGCSNTGTLHNTNEAANKDRDGALIGWAYGKALTDNGGNSTAKTDKMVGYQTAGTAGQSITGFKYATVTNDVATTVLPPLAVGNTYLLEGNVAASQTPVATLASGQTISFDTTLGYTFAGNVAAEAPLVAIPSTSGTVITYSTGYFPRTATAGQDGTAEHPFEIADLDDLEALKAYVDTTNCANIAFVQTADIDMTNAWPGIGVDAGKDKTAAVYEAGAFAGTYDGGNYTISNFSMVSGIDYGGLFNSVYNATIKNLKMSWGSSTLCSDSSSGGDDTGATFVGTAKGSTLQNLTALAGTVTTVSASKDMAGIVGYVYAGSTVESCTNHLNIASFKTSRKCGGIAIITQNGSGNAIFRNCYNSGTVTTPGTTYREGGIVGYVNVATTVDGCENTANVKLFHVEGSPTVTVTGTNKGYAGVASNDKGVSGLYFATVSGDVATFVADNALALNGSYKVMSTGATATFNFTEAGTIAFDTALYTPTYAISAAEGLTLTDETVGTVKTYTAAAPAPAYPTYLADADNTIKGLYDSWAEANGADSESTYEKQFLLGVSPRVEVPDAALHIAAITNNATAGWDIVVECAVENVALSGTVGTSRVANGYLAVSTAADLAGPWTTVNRPVTAVENGTVTVNVNRNGDAVFMKVQLSVCEQPDDN